MTAGLNALRAIIDTGSLNQFRKLRADWFIEEEADVYKFVRGHIKKYSRLPDVPTVKENGFQLPKVKEPPAYYIERLSERAVYNAVNDKHTELISAMRNRGVGEIKKALADMVQATRIVEQRHDYSTLREQAGIVEENYRKAKRRPGLQGITLGYGPLDDITNGGQGGDVIVIAGRPNKGKSYKLLNMMKAAHDDGFSPAVCSMEMTSNQLCTRYIGMQSKLNPDYIRRGELSTNMGEPVFLQTLDRIADMAPVHFLEGNFRKSVSEVDNLVQQFAPDILYIDAGYLLRPENFNKNFSKADYIGMVMEEIKSMAHDRNIPVVITVQLNRDAARVGKKGGGKQLDLANLAGTDVIAQAATVVIGLVDGKPPYETITRECQVIKNREGKLLTYQMNFNFSPMDFSYADGSEFVEGEEPAANNAQAQAEIEQMAEAGWER